MKVTIKTLNQESFKIEIKDTDKIEHLKEKIQEYKGAEAYPVENQQLIYSGSILDDSRPISHYKIDESKFIVVIITKSTANVNKLNTAPRDPLSSANATAANSSLSRPATTSQTPPNSRLSSTPNQEALSDASGALENLEQDLVSTARDDLNAFNAPGNSFSVEDLLQSALGNANASLPFDFARLNLNDGSIPFDLDGHGQLNDLKEAIERAGSLEAFISSAAASGNQPPSLLAAAMAVRDTSSHMGLSIDDTISMLTSEPPNPFSFPLPELDDFSFPPPPNITISETTENASQDEALNERLVSDIVAMGFDRDSVTAALAVCSNNPESAIEYLMTGIPPGFISDMENFLLDDPETSSPQETEPIAPPMPTPTNAPSPRRTVPRMPASPNDRSPFEYIRNHPDLRDTTSMIRENPEMLSVLLQRVADENPELLQYINSHQEELIEFLNSLPPSDLSNESEETYSEASMLTDGERSEVAQLIALGFSEIDSMQAYFAFDKDLELAAEFLLSNNHE